MSRGQLKITWSTILALHFHTGSPNFGKSSRVMAKLLGSNKKTRTAWHEPITAKAASLPQPFSFTKGSQKNRRVVVLNKLFMKTITDLMATGKCSSEISGLGVEVTKVKVGSEINVVNVYWISHGTHPEEYIANVLRRKAGELCQELTGLHIIGKVPSIQFVKDRSYGSWINVDSLLKVADYGSDYELHGHDSLKSEFENQEENSLNLQDLPPMRQNLYGLNRDDIMERIRLAMKGKSRKQPQELETIGSAQLVPFDRDAYKQFLIKRKIDKDRLIKTENSEQRFNNVVLEDDASDFEFIEQEDFVEEFDDEDKMK